VLVVRGVEKAFGATVALAGVDLEVRSGEIHAVVGENGAGKSTLMGILGGVIAKDRGTVELGGQAFAPASPGAARASGVAMVHQELSLCPHLTVAENIVLGVEPTRFGFLSTKEIDKRVEEVLLLTFGPADKRVVRASDRVLDLSTADRQLVEIARALSASSIGSGRVLILDEPTSSLGADDAARLMDLLRSLRKRGLAIVYISHFLEEVRALADRYTVLRDGKTVGTGTTGTTSTHDKHDERAWMADIVTKMVGRSVSELFPRSARTPGEIVLSLRGVAGVRKPRSASLDLRRGEVLGIAGIVGAGRTELLRAVFGLDRVRSGEIKVGAWAGPRSPAASLAHGVGLLSEDRAREGLATKMSIADNLTLSRLDGLGPRGFILRGQQHAVTARWMTKLGIKALGPAQAVRELSGGNQQKVALARLLHHGVDVLFLDEPTRGIDVNSKAEIYRLIDELASSGKAVLLVSSYLPELLGICDRVAVMCKGMLGPARPVAELDARKVLAEAIGAAT
jgi:ribose transport system ATP-binding protein